MRKIIYLLMLLIFTFTLSGCKKKTADVPVTPPARKVEQINQLPVKDRPFVTLVPRADGKEVTLNIAEVKNATKVEYELEYQTATLIQGAFGNIDFSKDPLPASKNLLFGSCSKGACKYDEGVSGGSLIMTFDGGDKPYALKTEFNLQQMFDRGGVFTSKDVKATLDVGKTSLPNNTFVVISGTMGLPAEANGEVMAGPYAFLAASSPVVKGTITIQSKDDLTGAKLMFWNSKVWTDLKATITEGKISAPVTALGTFVVVK